MWNKLKAIVGELLENASMRECRNSIRYWEKQRNEALRRAEFCYKALSTYRNRLQKMKLERGY